MKKPIIIIETPEMVYGKAYDNLAVANFLASGLWAKAKEGGNAVNTRIRVVIGEVSDPEWTGTIDEVPAFAFDSGENK